jgi:hypothetical protein
MIFLACWWGRFIDWLEGHEPSAQVFAALAMLAVTVGLVIATFLYAKSARRQADASRQMAEAALRPLILLWTGPAPYAGGDQAHGPPYTLNYWNIGSGPALNITIRPDSTAAQWFEPSKRVGMGVRDEKTRIKVGVTLPSPDQFDVVAEYDDAFQCRWRTTLTLYKEDSLLRNGESKVERVEG